MPHSIGLTKMTPYQLVESLVAHINTVHADDFNHLQVRPYGFQAPGLLNPNAVASGYRLRGIRGMNLDPAGKPATLPILLGKIMPMPQPIGTSARDAFEFGQKIAQTIMEWGNCGAANGLTEWVRVDFDIDRGQQADVSSSREKAWWWILRWQIELEGYFDFPE